MRKNILLQKIELDEYGCPLINIEELSVIHRMVKETIPEDYVLITSPMDLIKVDGDMKIVKIDCREYSYNELQEIIEKASMYDGLCD